MTEPTFESIRLASGIRLHTAFAGPETGPPLILLHGFPEFWFSWRKQIPVLAKAGFRIIAPDQRGYNLSDKPKRFKNYDPYLISEDVIELMQALSIQKAFLAGHDWGGLIAWWTVRRFPQNIEKMIVINAPHPSALRKMLKTRWSQRLKSWYIYAFQIPVLSETILRLHRFETIVRSMRKSSLPGTFTESDFEKYRESWAQPGALTAMLNWYRAGLRIRHRKPSDPAINVPVLLIWGMHDSFFISEVAQASVELCKDGRLELYEDATHWVHHEFPDRVSSAMIEFLRK